MHAWFFQANITMVLWLLIIFCLVFVSIEGRFMDFLDDTPSNGTNFTRCQNDHLPSIGIMVDLLVHTKQT